VRGTRFIRMFSNGSFYVDVRVGAQTLDRRDVHRIAFVEVATFHQHLCNALLGNRDSIP